MLSLQQIDGSSYESDKKLFGNDSVWLLRSKILSKRMKN